MEKDKLKSSYKNISVDVNIIATLSGVDQSLLNVDISDCFKIREIFLNEFKSNFIAIVKNKKIKFTNAAQTLSNEILDVNMRKYLNRQTRTINNIILKMRLFKEGAINIDNILLSYNCPELGVENNNLVIKNKSELCVSTLGTYFIHNNEVNKFNKFMTTNKQAFSFLMHIINEFNSSYNLPICVNAFEQIIKTNEMMFLVPYKELLSKTMAVFLGTDNNNNNTWDIYHKLKSFYRYRSEITYEIVDINIIKSELLAFRQYTRESILKYINIINDELELWLSSFQTIESEVMSNLNHKVAIAMRHGILPY